MSDPDYQQLSEAHISMDSEGDYDYPQSLDLAPQPPARLEPSDSPPSYENIILESTDELDGDSIYVRPPHRQSVKQSDDFEASQKIYVRGSLINPRTSIYVGSRRLRSVSDIEESTSSLTQLVGQGIFQGLSQADRDKQAMGIVPEGIFITENLMQNYSAEMEEMGVANGEDVRTRLNTTADLVDGGPTILQPAQKERAGCPIRRSSSVSTPRHIVPRYRNYSIRPPPLPPIQTQATLAERKACSVVESLLKSEASLLSSLQVAIQVYQRPLVEMSLGPSPILTQQQVGTLFGPIEKILGAHELFYSALTSRTLDWNNEQKLGDVFLSSLATKEVIRHYSGYVNNFTSAINILEQGLRKKPKFVTFIRQRYEQSNTSLSLQGLLLKPVQRFPQYIMFIQDLLKYTAPTHPDRITLQMALAKFEGITVYLNESKRSTEQRTIVEYLNNRVSKLPFKLVDSRKRWLHRQDVVTRLLVSNGKVSIKKRYLLLFNNMVLCAAPNNKKRISSRYDEMNSTTGSRLFRAVEGYYTCIWYCPIDKLEVLQPNYNNDVWDKFAGTDVVPTDIEQYQRAKSEYSQLEHDFNTMSKIASISATLHNTYRGLSSSDISSHVRVLQRQLARVREEIETHQLGRLDICIPARDGSTNTSKAYHTYVFPNKTVKKDWLNTLRYVQLKLNRHNKDAWVTSEDTSDEDFFDLSHKLPLLVETYRLSMLHTLNSVQCGTKVGANSAWLVSGDQVTVLECVTPSPLILESFKLDMSRVIDILYVPPSTTYSDATLTDTLRRLSDLPTGDATLTSLPPTMATVWLGAECGSLSVYSSDCSVDGVKTCISTVKLSDAITSLQYYRDQVAVSTAEGSIIIFHRNYMGWNLAQRVTIPVVNKAIRCTCVVKNKLWIGVNNECYFLNLQTHKLEEKLEMSSSRVVVSRMVCWGEGVWVSFKGSPSLELFHTITRNSLQNIDIKSTLVSIMKRQELHEKYPISEQVHVTALLASSGYLWIGTSMGIIMVYRIPLIRGVPLVSAKPYLSMDAHKGRVRVIMAVKTQATVNSTRLNQFLVAEKLDIRTSQVISGDKETPSPEGSPDPPTLPSLNELPEDAHHYENSADFQEDTLRLVRSQTPVLPHPATVEVEASVYQSGEVELYTPINSDSDNFEDSTQLERTTDLGGKDSIPFTSIEESLDFRDGGPQTVKLSQPPPAPPSKPPRRGNEMPSLELHGGDRSTTHSESGLYSPLVTPTSTQGALDKHRVKDLYLEGSDSIEQSYQDPVELESLTMRRVPSDEVARKLSEGAGNGGGAGDMGSSGVVLRRKTGGVLPTPYVDPASLDRNGDCVASVC